MQSEAVLVGIPLHRLLLGVELLPLLEPQHPLPRRPPQVFLPWTTALVQVVHRVLAVPQAVAVWG